MRLEFTKAAASDLQSIRSYTFETWGAEQEQCYLDDLWKKFEEILADPTRWRQREDLFPGCRIAAQGKHVILFRTEGAILQIVRILHSAMDFPRHLPGERESQ
jgi:toxin ParE1/3/4